MGLHQRCVAAGPKAPAPPPAAPATQTLPSAVPVASAVASPWHQQCQRWLGLHQRHVACCARGTSASVATSSTSDVNTAISSCSGTVAEKTASGPLLIVTREYNADTIGRAVVVGADVNAGRLKDNEEFHVVGVARCTKQPSGATLRQPSVSQPPVKTSIKQTILATLPCTVGPQAAQWPGRNCRTPLGASGTYRRDRPDWRNSRGQAALVGPPPTLRPLCGQRTGPRLRQNTGGRCEDHQGNHEMDV